MRHAHFSMPWDDIERCCQAAAQHARGVCDDRLKLLQENLGVPHSEDTLAMLVNVHIVGGSKDLALHLKGLTLRIPVIERLLTLQSVRRTVSYTHLTLPTTPYV